MLPHCELSERPHVRAWVRDSAAAGPSCQVAGKLKDGGRFVEFAPPRLRGCFDFATMTRPKHSLTRDDRGTQVVILEIESLGEQPKVRYDREEGQPELRHIAVRNLYRALLRVNLKHVPRPCGHPSPIPARAKLARSLPAI